jgi:hypothetical protein
MLKELGHETEFTYMNKNVGIAISHAVKMKTCWRKHTLKRYVPCAAFILAELFILIFSIVLSPICFSKLLNDYWRAAEKWFNLSLAVKYDLLVH